MWGRRGRGTRGGRLLVVVLGALMTGPGGASLAQTPVIPLPEVTVTAPSPIVRGTFRPPGTDAVLPMPSAETLQGTLPIVTDQFATVTVVPNEELRRNGGATLGDILFSKPGVTGSGFAPGASSRPIIRGLDVNRVGIVANGLGAGGASDLGEDHAVPLDPLSTGRIEVIRGPAALRYGSQAVGGVVSGSSNRIPEAIPQRGVSAEVRGSASTASNGLDGAVLLDAGHGNVAFHLDAFGRRSGDYRIPSYPYLVAPDPLELPRATQPGAFNSRQPNSAVRSTGEAAGASYLFDGGFAGIAIEQFNSLYGIPGIDGENHNTRIDMRQTRLTAKGEVRPSSAALDTVRFWLGANDYKHREIGLADPLDLASDGVRQTFTNKEQEGRLEATLTPADLRVAQVTTALGLQGGHQALTAPGADGPGLWDPNRNWRMAAYVFSEFAFSDATRAQLAGRIERVRLEGTTPDFPADHLPAPGPDPAGVARSRDFAPKSISIGLIQNLPWDLVGSVTAQRVERAPKPAELFSRGPHDATGTFDIGNPNLGIETARSLEVGVRRAAGPFRFEATAYMTRFDGFIFRNLNGNMCDDTFTTCNNLGTGELRQAVYSQRDALFRGAEFQSQLDLLPVHRGWFGIENQFDIVRATFTDGSSVPRIPPMRAGGGLFYRDANWLARISLLHAFAHRQVAVTPTFVETPTPGYDNLKVELSYRWAPFRPSHDGLREMRVGVVGDNLLDDQIRNSVSYTKDEVPMPGRSIRAFFTVQY